MSLLYIYSPFWDLWIPRSWQAAMPPEDCPCNRVEDAAREMQAREAAAAYDREMAVGGSVELEAAELPF